MDNKNQLSIKSCRGGLTLVELLVVITIMVALLSLSVPLLKPLLQSRRTANAAQVLASTLQQARMKSIQERKPYGIKFIPFVNAPTTSIQLRLQKNNSYVVNAPDTRVVVRDGEIKIYEYDTSLGWKPASGPVPAELQRAGKIQFRRQGRFYPFAKGKLMAPYDALTLPDNFTSENEAMEYLVAPLPVSTFTPQVVMPRGMVIDLAFSGGESVNFEGKSKFDSGGTLQADTIPPTFSSGDIVTVMFSTLGNVDAVYINDTRYLVNEMLYFCIGEWDRQVDADGKTLAEDEKSNLESSASYWVTLHPKTGEVRTAENAPMKSGSSTPVEKLRDARKFATEHFFNIGGN